MTSAFDGTMGKVGVVEDTVNGGVGVVKAAVDGVKMSVGEVVNPVVETVNENIDWPGAQQAGGPQYTLQDLLNYLFYVPFVPMFYCITLMYY